MTGVKRADELPARNQVADVQGRGHGLIGGAQTAGMRHADHPAIGQASRIDDHPGTGGVDH